MRYVKCPACGMETPAAITRCTHCSNRLPNELLAPPEPLQAVGYVSNYNPADEPAGRNLFLTVWFWLAIVCNSIFGLVMMMFTMFGSDGIDTVVYGVLSCLASFAIAGGYAMLLMGRKLGFFLVCLANVVFSVAILIDKPDFMIITSAVASVFVLYGLLQLRKNGVPYWKILR